MRGARSVVYGVENENSAVTMRQENGRRTFLKLIYVYDSLIPFAGNYNTTVVQIQNSRVPGTPKLSRRIGYCYRCGLTFAFDLGQIQHGAVGPLGRGQVQGLFVRASLGPSEYVGHVVGSGRLGGVAVHVGVPRASDRQLRRRNGRYDHAG